MSASKKTGKVGYRSRMKGRVKVRGKDRGRSQLKVGLTGSIASGKSTALKLFRRLGWKTISADELVTQIYKAKGTTKAKLKAEFFSDPKMREANLRTFERWIHPLVEKEIRRWMLKIKGYPRMVEVPLLFEAKLDRQFDQNIFVFAPLAVRKKRAQKRDKKRGMDPKLFKFLESRQLSALEKARRSDFILNNIGNLTQLRRQIGILSKYLQK